LQAAVVVATVTDQVVVEQADIEQMYLDKHLVETQLLNLL
jgi:hypothetical protein